MLTVVASKDCMWDTLSRFLLSAGIVYDIHMGVCSPSGNVLLPRCQQDALIPNWTLAASAVTTLTHGKWLIKHVFLMGCI